MKRFARPLCLTFGLAFCLAVSGSADDKKDVAPKGQLPPNFGKLGLSDEQKSKIYAVQAKARTKIAELKKQIEEVQKEEKTAMFEVLTDTQKARFKELAIPGGSGNSKTDKKGEDKPTTDKPK